MASRAKPIRQYELRFALYMYMLYVSHPLTCMYHNSSAYHIYTTWVELEHNHFSLGKCIRVGIRCRPFF